MTRSARLALFHAHSPMVGRLVRARFRVSARAGHGDDLVQAGLLAVWRATAFYDPARGAFGSLALTSAWRDIMKEAKRLRCAVRNDSLATGTMRAGLCILPVHGGGSLEEEARGAVVLSVDALQPDTSAWLLRHLAPRTAAIVRRVVIDGDALSAVADDYGQSKQAISQRVRPGLRVLRRALALEAA